jgi:hypothetical protein
MTWHADRPPGTDGPLCLADLRRSHRRTTGHPERPATPRSLDGPAALHPPVAVVIHGDTALGQQLLNIAVGQAVAGTTAPHEITSRGNRKPAKTRSYGGAHRTSSGQPRSTNATARLYRAAIRWKEVIDVLLSARDLARRAGFFHPRCAGRSRPKSSPTARRSTCGCLMSWSLGAAHHGRHANNPVR